MLSEMSVEMRRFFLFSPYSIPLLTSLCMLVDLDDTRSELKWTEVDWTGTSQNLFVSYNKRIWRFLWRGSRCVALR